MIGVGDFVEYIGSNNSYSLGAVRVVSELSERHCGPCSTCGLTGPGFFVSTDPPALRSFAAWCTCAWKPYHGPEQSVLTCEEITA